MGRELWETVTELVGAMIDTKVDSEDVTVTGMTVDLPIEFTVVKTVVGFRLLMDAPHYRWDPGLRPTPGRLRLELVMTTPEETARVTRLIGDQVDV